MCYQAGSSTLINKKRISFDEYLVIFVVIFASVRGLFVYYFGVQPSLVYMISSAALILVGLISFIRFPRTISLREIKLFKMSVALNWFLMSCYFVVEFSEFGHYSWGMVYLFAVFPIVFRLVRYDEFVLNFIVFSVMWITAVGVFTFYSLGVAGGFEAIETANLALRPGDLSYSRIGENLLPAGYQGNHHDASNILVMCAVFLLSKAALAQTKISILLYFALYIAVSSSLILTGSAANISVFIFCSILILVIVIRNAPAEFWVAVLLAVFLAVCFSKNLKDYIYFLDKIKDDQSNLPGGGIFNSLDFDSISNSLYSVLFGFGALFDSPLINSEVAFVKILVTVGILPFCVLMFVCLSPYYYIIKHKSARAVDLRIVETKMSSTAHSAYSLKVARSNQIRLVLFAMPVLAGVMTLLHYGSLFRITSIALFAVFLALFFKQYISIKLEE